MICLSTFKGGMRGGGVKRGMKLLWITLLTGGNDRIHERHGTWAKKELLQISLSRQKKKN